MMVKSLTIPSNPEVFYSMYYAYMKEPRIFKTKLTKFVGKSPNTVSKYMKIAEENDVLFPPQLRLKMTKETSEYMYFIKVDDPTEWLSLLEESGAFYVCFLSGFYNVMVMSYKPITVSGLPRYKDTLLSGKRSNYVVPTVPKHDFDKAYQKIDMKLKAEPDPSVLSLDFPDGKYWSEEVWFLYHILKYNFRLNYTPIIKKYHISVSSFYSRIEKIKSQTDVYVPFYPLGQMHYTIFHLLIKSRYHKFLIDCFSEFPASSLHCRIEDYLFSRVAISKWTEMTEFLKLLLSLQHLGYIEDYETSLPFESEVFHPGSPFPPPSP
ncbi:MAG: hypothetical protein HXS47_07795 [Theionarchaea archaeon]|nr:hypothetical protein [Theionarchaea archaeon]